MEKEILEKLDRIQKKRTIKLVIVMSIISIILGSVAGVTAYAVNASQVVYKPTDKTWKVSNVNDAIESLKLSKTGDNYKTEEQVVGTWIDGKPIYQKTIESTVNVSNYEWESFNVASLDDFNADIVIELTAIYANTVLVPRIMPKISVSDSNNTVINPYSRFIYISDKIIWFSGYNINGDYKLYTTIKYTKKDTTNNG